ncbi:MAG: lipocalin family protein [Bdellovibrionales bacterium]|nr:lipocalin family protein [Bdellovibrionales bacterium]
MSKKSSAFLMSVLALLMVNSGSVAHAMGPKHPKPELATVPFVDLNRYLGRWYEISSFPQKFAKGCTGTRATYTLNHDGSVAVLNECNLNSLDGKLKQAKGKAVVVDRESNSKLKVSFFWPFYGDYWIVDLGANYEYAVVGAPDRDYLWILSRTTSMNETTYNEILERLTAKGFDVSRLEKMVQP